MTTDVSVRPYVIVPAYHLHIVSSMNHVLFSGRAYYESRFLPPAGLRFFNFRLGPVYWLCLGIGFASITVGVDCSQNSAHHFAHQDDEEAPTCEPLYRETLYEMAS